MHAETGLIQAAMEFPGKSPGGITFGADQNNCIRLSGIGVVRKLP
jgi:hypothetical protein